MFTSPAGRPLQRARRAARRLILPVLRRLRPGIRIQVENQSMFVDLQDLYISRLLFTEGVYEARLRAMMRRLSLLNSTCLDVGANIGLHTLLLSRLVGPSGTVYAFEPDHYNYVLLTRNLALNGASNVIALESAVGSREGRCMLASDPASFGDHRVMKPSQNRRCTEVQITTIDKMLETCPDGMVKLAKVDVEGYEGHVLDGMHATLERNHDIVLIVEIWPAGLRAAGHSPGVLVQRLLGAGFTGWEIQQEKAVALREPVHYELIANYCDLVLSRNPKVVSDLGKA